MFFLKYHLRTALFTAFFLLLLVGTPTLGYMFLKPIQIGSSRCIDDSLIPHLVGDSWYDDKNCERLTCVYLEEILYISGYGCGKLGYSPECHVIKGKGHYPKCCSHVEC
ncbi:toxin-like protein 14 [Limulus polyphemus]|uniref:Toxin-like protein 14 n=1 Tax=Limulus polyphemus TaxID=6850 RepID=A0ABM1C1C6_LIMPO|nr:toxin-like protein 14 [Limulus polyphemus]